MAQGTGPANQTAVGVIGHHRRTRGRLQRCACGVMNIRVLCGAAVLSLGMTQDRPVPAADHHQHLYNPALGALTLGEPETSADLIRLLDQAGIRNAVLFSIAYQFGNPNRPPVADEYEKVKAENDRVS